MLGPAVLGEIAGQEAEIGPFLVALHLGDYFFKPLAAALVEIMDVVDHEEVKCRGVPGAFREESTRPASGGQQAAGTEAEHLAAVELVMLGHLCSVTVWPSP